jgi:hypothetical protein
MPSDPGVWTAEDCCLTFATVQAVPASALAVGVAEAEKRAASAHGGH